MACSTPGRRYVLSHEVTYSLSRALRLMTPSRSRKTKLIFRKLIAPPRLMTKLPKRFSPLASSGNCVYSALVDARPGYGLGCATVRGLIDESSKLWSLAAVRPGVLAVEDSPLRVPPVIC